MAKDGLQIRLEGGARLDRVLSKMAITHQSASSKIVNQSLSKGAGETRKVMKSKIPKAKKDTTGFKLASRNVSKGQLRNSLKSGLRSKVNVGRNVFLAGVWFNEGQNEKSKKKDDGFFAKFVYDNPHKDNAFGFSGGRNLSKIVKPAIAKFKKTVGSQLALKIAAFDQKQINKLG